MRTAVVGSLLVLSVTLACGESGTGPGDVGPPAALLIVGGNQQQDTVGRELGGVLVVRVVDAEGRVLWVWRLAKAGPPLAHAPPPKAGQPPAHAPPAHEEPCGVSDVLSIEVEEL